MSKTKKAPNLYRVKPDTSAGRTVRQALYDAAVTAKREKATKVVVVMQVGDGDVYVKAGGANWLERTGLLEIAKQC